MANLIIPASTGHNVDDRFSPLVEPNLFAGNVFQPGVTFTDKYQLDAAGQIIVHKPGVSVLTPTLPGASDFSDTIVQDSLITISLNREIKRSRKMYAVVAATVAYASAAAEIETALAEVREAWNLDHIAAFNEPGMYVKSSNAAVAVNEAYNEIVDARKALRELKANPDVLIVSPAFYAKLLKAPEFQRSVDRDTQVIRDAFVGRVAGLNVYEYESLNSGVANGTTFTNVAINGSTGNITWNAAADELEFVMYDHDALSIVTAVTAVRVVDEPTRFVGSLAQAQINYGRKLTNGSRALIRIKDAA